MGDGGGELRQAFATSATRLPSESTTLPFLTILPSLFLTSPNHLNNFV